jgi:hypothetical protein
LILLSLLPTSHSPSPDCYSYSMSQMHCGWRSRENYLL